MVLARGSLLHAIGMAVLGLLLGLIGTDVNSGIARYTFDIPQLADGIGFVVVAMGIFGLAEIVRNLEGDDQRAVIARRVSGLMLTQDDFKRIWKPILRGTALGSALGILPGNGALLGSFSAYSIDKEAFAESSAIWPWRNRRRCRTRSGQQRRRTNLFRADTDIGHSVEPGHGTNDRRHDHSRYPAGPVSHDGTA